MKAPAFWYRPAGLQAALLSPLAVIWAGVTAWRLQREPEFHPGIPVLCVGNLVAGGAGKTPVVRHLAELLLARGVNAAALSRGHGGRLAGPLAVDPTRHSAADVGDEPLLLSRHVPAWIGRDRAAAAMAMRQAGIQAIVMDDGFQNPGLAKDISLIVADAGAGFGNGRVIPAGPLREPVAVGLARAQAVLLMGTETAAAGPVRQAAARAGLPVLSAGLTPDPAAAAALAGRRVLAFAGIGRPEKFFDTLRGIGTMPVSTLPFPDHHPYMAGEVQALLDRAQALDAVPVTTEKDAMRLPDGLRERVLVLPVRAQFADAAALEQILDRLLIGVGNGDA
jgi:tetraacyldisaccharide 4'-kinase